MKSPHVAPEPAGADLPAAVEDVSESGAGDPPLRPRRSSSKTDPVPEEIECTITLGEWKELTGR